MKNLSQISKPTCSKTLFVFAQREMSLLPSIRKLSVENRSAYGFFKGLVKKKKDFFNIFVCYRRFVIGIVYIPYMVGFYIYFYVYAIPTYLFVYISFIPLTGDCNHEK